MALDLPGGGRQHDRLRGRGLRGRWSRVARGLVGALAADGDAGHGGAAGHAVAEPDGGQRRRPPRRRAARRPRRTASGAAPRRRLLPVDLVGQGRRRVTRCSRSSPGSAPGPGPRCRAGRCERTCATTIAWSPAGWMSVVRHSRCISAPSSSATPVAGPRWCGARSSWPCSGRPRVANHSDSGRWSAASTLTPKTPRLEHGVVPPGLVLGADEHEQRVERDRGEGVGGHGVVVPLGEAS